LTRRSRASVFKPFAFRRDADGFRAMASSNSVNPSISTTSRLLAATFASASACCAARASPGIAASSRSPMANGSDDCPMPVTLGPPGRDEMITAATTSAQRGRSSGASGIARLARTSGTAQRARIGACRIASARHASARRPHCPPAWIHDCARIADT
jgi:hypothetical protein